MGAEGSISTNSNYRNDHYDNNDNGSRSNAGVLSVEIPSHFVKTWSVIGQIIYVNTPYNKILERLQASNNFLL